MKEIFMSVISYKFIYLFIYLSCRDNPSGSRNPPCRGFAITLRHTTVGRTSLDE